MATTQQVTTPPNPTGKGGFGEHPENRNPGGWKKENTISYQYNRFLNMTPEELKAYNDVPDKERTVAMDIAYSQVLASRKSLPHTREITDRTEGKAAQAIDLTSSDGSMTPTVIIESTYGNKPNFRPDNSATEADDLAEDSSEQSS